MVMRDRALVLNSFLVNIFYFRFFFLSCPNPELCRLFFVVIGSASFDHMVTRCHLRDIKEETVVDWLENKIR